jgi:hypothetical protein
VFGWEAAAGIGVGGGAGEVCWPKAGIAIIARRNQVANVATNREDQVGFMVSRPSWRPFAWVAAETCASRREQRRAVDIQAREASL